MDRDYYRKYYFLEREHWWFRVRAGIINKVFTKYIGKNTETAILNAGVATGGTSELLAGFGQVSSIEPDSECCRFLRSELKMEVIEASATALPFKNETFDVACVFDVLEHIREDDIAVKELWRVSKKSGWLVLTVPAYPWLWSRHDDINHHVRRYKWRNLKKLMRENGYRIEYISGFNSLLFVPIAIYRLLSGLAAKKNRPVRSDFDIPFFKKQPFLNKIFYTVFGIEKTILPYVRLPFGVSIIVVARKI